MNIDENRRIRCGLTKFIYMKTKKLPLFFALAFCSLCLMPYDSVAQWGVALEYNLAFPITGYGEVFGNGFNFNAEGKYHFQKGWGAGFQMGTARFTKFEEGSLPLYDAKLTVVPLIFTGEYEFNRDDVIRPYVAAGLGVSIFSFSYYIDDPVLSTSETNVSFTMSPQIGVRFWFSKNMMTYFKGSYIILTDGPPVIMESNPPITFPESDKATGYAGIAFGLSYRFIKK